MSPKHLRAKEPQTYKQFNEWARTHPKQYEELVNRAFSPGVYGEALLERTYNLWKIERGVS